MHASSWLKFSLCLACLLPLSASISCHKLDVPEFPDTADPVFEMARLERYLAKARVLQIDVLSAEYFKASEAEFNLAKTTQASNQGARIVLKHVALGQANLAKAHEIAIRAKSILEPVIHARAAAMAADSQHQYSEHLLNIDKGLVEISKVVDSFDLATAEKSCAELTKRYQQLKLAAIQETYLGQARKLIELADSEGAKDTAKLTRDIALTKMDEAEKYIVNHDSDKAGMESISQVANNSAQRLLDISRQAKMLDKKDAESLVLNREAQFIKDRDAAIANAKNQQQAEDLATKTKAASLESTTLDAKKRSDALFKTAQSRFAIDEAEVYRDGQKFTIRLNSNALPANRGNLQPKAIQMLAKVNKTIHELGITSRIEIRFHKNSAGNQLSMQKQLQQHASAIKSYLSSHGLAANNLSIHVDDDSKPVADTRNKSSRARNFTIDIVIEAPNPVS